MRLEETIRADMTVGEVKRSYPATIPVFAELGFRDAFDEAPIEAVCRRLALDSRDVVRRLNAAAVRAA